MALKPSLQLLIVADYCSPCEDLQGRTACRLKREMARQEAKRQRDEEERQRQAAAARAAEEAEAARRAEAAAQQVCIIHLLFSKTLVHLGWYSSI